MATKPKKPVEQPKPLETYGCNLAGYDQAWYDARAFAAKIPLDKGAPTRDVLFWKLADRWVPNYFEKHDWTLKVVNTLLEYKWVSVAGCSGCVAGHTRIFNPITGEEPTIKELCEKGIAPVVMTLDGPVQADVPYLKGVDDLFEVTTDNGCRFISTADHLSMTSTGFLRVGDFRPGTEIVSSVQGRPLSTEEFGQLIRGVNDYQNQEIAEGFQDDCLHVWRSCDEQPPWEVNNDRSSFPSQVYVPEHIRRGSHSDGWGSICGCTLGYPCAPHPSSLKPFPRHSWADSRGEYHSVSGIFEPNCGMFQQPPLFSLSKHHLGPCQLLNHGSSGTLKQPSSLFGNHSESKTSLSSPPSPRKPSSCQPKWPHCEPFSATTLCDSRTASNTHSYNHNIFKTKVVSIRWMGKSEYYDISVPIREHYLAEGIFHHNSAKTRNIVGWACTWWMAAPLDSSVLLCSTTAKALRKRGWAEVQRYFSSIPERPGNFVDSRMLWQSKKGDDKHAISGIAVEEGQMLKVADNIKGWHTRRQMVIIDEATAVPPAIFEACSNLYGTPQEFILVMIGNPRARLDEFGKFSEPVGGWDSVSVDDEEWETTPKLDGVNGICIRFDAEKSPNILNPLPDGKLISKYLPTKERVERSKKNAGSENTPSYWSNERGFWAPEGLSKNVFSETRFIAGRAYDKHKFTGNNFSIIAALDPARTGGDKAKLRFGALGEIEGGQWGLESMPPILIPVNARSSNPIDYQVVEQVRRECENVNYRGEKYACPPENFGVDDSGGGADLGDIFQRTWSAKIMRVLFGGPPSEDPCSHEDVRPANKVYKTKRAFMYFRASDMVDAKQIAGMDSETARELCSLTFNDDKPLINMISKVDYKKAYGKSPDDSDSFIILCEVARRKGFRLAVTGETIHRSQEHEKLVETAHAVYSDISYSDYESEEDFETVY